MAELLGLYIIAGLIFTWLDRLFIYREIVSTLRYLKFDLGDKAKSVPVRYWCIYVGASVGFAILFWPYILYNIVKKG